NESSGMIPRRRGEYQRTSPLRESAMGKYPALYPARRNSGSMIDEPGGFSEAFTLLRVAGRRRAVPVPPLPAVEMLGLTDRFGWEVEDLFGELLHDEPYDVLHRNHREGPVLFVHDRNVPVTSDVHRIEHKCHAVVRLERHGIGRHQLLHRDRVEIEAF